MKVLFATTNPAKVKKYADKLAEKNVELLTIKDLNLNLEINENGKNAIENAKIKAKAYYEETGITTIGMDNTLFIEELPEEKQPGTHVRRVNGKELSDDEMIEYYTNLINSVGGNSISYYITGLALVGENGIVTTEIKEDEFILSSTISKNRNHRGNPLDVMTIDPIINKYYTEMSDEEFKHLGQIFDIKCIEFIVTNLLENKKTLKKS